MPNFEAKEANVKLNVAALKREKALIDREEAEMELIDRSVNLDLENKKIVCNLPVKGEERQFLSTNYAQALKILEQQVRQYSNQPETRELIIKAFKTFLIWLTNLLLEICTGMLQT